MSANSFRTLNDRSAVKNALIRALERNQQDGLSTADTREVAGRCGFSLSRTRRHLWALHAAGEVEAFDEEGNVMGKVILWGLDARQALSGEPST